MSYTQSFGLSLPEIVLSLGAIVLMLVAAWVGDKASKPIGYAAIALLAVAAFTLLGASGHGGVGYDGQYLADPFAAAYLRYWRELCGACR